MPQCPTLAPFLRNATRLTLANLGLPPPSTHLDALLAACGGHDDHTPHDVWSTLQHFAMSSLRDLSAPMLAHLLHSRLRPSVAPRLKSLKFGALLSDQITVLAGNGDGGSGLAELTQLDELTFTTPHLSRQVLVNMPRSLLCLCVRTPAVARDATTSDSHSTSGLRSATTALSIEQLEEEGSIVRMMIEALVQDRAGPNLREVRWEGERDRARLVASRIQNGLEHCRPEVRVVAVGL